MDDTLKVFTSYDIQACLYDERRVELFRRAISDVVKPGDIVVDGGSGTGLLGMFAAEAGAAKVYCVEISEDYVDIIGRNARLNGMPDIIVPIHGDAASCDLPGPVDVIVCEVISAGFFYEPQLQIVDNLRRYLKPDGSIVPIAMENSLELINAQDKLYGLTFTYDTRWRGLPEDRALTDKVRYLSTKFREHTDAAISETTRLRATASGLANAVRVSYSIEFTQDAWEDQPTEFLMNPQIIFLPEPVELEAGRQYEVSMSYMASSSPLTAKISVHPLDRPTPAQAVPAAARG